MSPTLAERSFDISFEDIAYHTLPSLEALEKAAKHCKIISANPDLWVSKEAREKHTHLKLEDFELAQIAVENSGDSSKWMYGLQLRRKDQEEISEADYDKYSDFYFHTLTQSDLDNYFPSNMTTN